MFFKRFFCALLCALLLCSCGNRAEPQQSDSQAVTIETFGTVSEEAQTAPPETLNAESLTESETSATVPPWSTTPKPSDEPSSQQTERPTETSIRTEKTEKPASSKDFDDYVITPASGEMTANASVNVRSLPNADSERIGHLDKGEAVTITGLVSNGWVRVLFKDGEYFVNGSYLDEASSPKEPEQTAPATEPPETTEKPQSTEPTTSESGDEYVIMEASGTMTVTDTLNVREQPDTSGKKVGTLKKGETVTVTGLVSNGWVRILFEGKTCFVSGDYLSSLTEDPGPDEEIPAEKPDQNEYNFEDNLNVTTARNSYNALNYQTQKAVWLAYLDIDDMLKNASKAEFTSSVGSAFDNVVSLGCNTVYVHVRAFGDSYYYSRYFPFTAAYGDMLGLAPDYDPLEIMIQEAHSRGLSFHAWINPMRTAQKERYAEMPSDFVLKQWYDSSTLNGTFLVYDSDSGCYWLSPAYPAVRQLICNGVAEIVSKYNVDAIHIDDYFYPTTSSSFDKVAFEASGASDRASWRRSVVSSLVKEIYSTVKACNKTVLFGVSPQGNIENNRDRLYADVETWCSSSGYLDYIVPQIYYGFNDKLSFDTAAEQWANTVKRSNISLVCGIAAYKVGVNTEWSSGEILKKQTDYAAGLSGFGGVAYYRLGSLFGSASSSPRLMKTELDGLRSAVKSFR